MPQFCVVGAGGIGCAIGYALREAGVSVDFIDAQPNKVRHGQRDGVRVDHKPALPATFLSFEEWKPAANAIVLLCTKCYDNATVLKKLPAGVCLIPIQNGFDPQLASQNHAFEGIASFVSECLPDRPHTRITRSGALHLGARGHHDSTTLPAIIREVFVPALQSTTLFRVVEVDPIEPIKYAKLMYNAAISPLAAAAGIDNGQLLSVPLARALFFALLQENYRILQAAGVELGKVGPFHPRVVAWILRQKWLAGLMARAFEPSLRGTYCSMAGEIQKGRTEIDNYNGHLLDLAKSTGVPCPLNQAVYELVTGMTHSSATPTRDVLETLRNQASGLSPVAA